MTRHELHQALVQYRAGLEAEIALLRQLPAPSKAGRPARGLTVAEACAEADNRDRLLANIASIEHDLTYLRHGLFAARTALGGTVEFEQVMELQRRVRELVGRVLASDRRAIEAFEGATRARRFLAADPDTGDAHLAAYRRVVAPPLEGARIVDRRG